MTRRTAHAVLLPLSVRPARALSNGARPPSAVRRCSSAAAARAGPPWPAAACCCWVRRRRGAGGAAAERTPPPLGPATMSAAGGQPRGELHVGLARQSLGRGAVFGGQVLEAEVHATTAACTTHLPSAQPHRAQPRPTAQHTAAINNPPYSSRPDAIATPDPLLALTLLAVVMVRTPQPRGRAPRERRPSRRLGRRFLGASCRAPARSGSPLRGARLGRWWEGRGHRL